jgi:hypothetical protein
MRRRRFGPSVLLLCAVLVAPLQSTAYAGVISTEQYLASVDRQHALSRIDAVLARADVQQRLEQLGVDPVEAIARAAALSDAELVALAANLEELPAGGSLLGVLGVVFIVLLVLELVGVTNIFTKI